MSLSRLCDFCRTANTDVRRYGLMFYAERTDRKRPGDGRNYYRQRNAGGIDLCNNCWQRFAAPKMRSSKHRIKGLHPSLHGSNLQVSRQTEQRLRDTDKIEGVTKL